ncbi:DUF6984 family protein [Chitinophaga nivalis]|uniref:DUF6984 domain-containing protein n=1 Tax=Chitinophaga nivalis TaxID=2991709 RepID=A0ABT3IH42_9BACT|nr:hypothetical protein [Chitinophaga nivalis]MCW3467040.1 hypothetical protein [Chitinophaga nivalis]MCW3483269.1 hypothetical protein [Chitinophaga nivalis]
MPLTRKPTPQEASLLTRLIHTSALSLPENWRETLSVAPMNDSGMGSLYLFPQGKVIVNRQFGEQVSESQFTDRDGIAVIVSLHTDEQGELFELDVWKTDFNPLISFPEMEW